jgi:DNA-binding transcriptional MerR regulator
MPKKKARARRGRAVPAGSYTQRDICRILPVKAAQLEYWVRSRAVTPQLPSDGRGRYRLFSFANIVEFEVCRLLTAAGFAVEECRDATNIALKLEDPDDAFDKGPEQEAIWAETRQQRIARFGREHVERDEREVADAWAASNRDHADPEADQELAVRLQVWRRFKNPATRGHLRFSLVRTVFDATAHVHWSLVLEQNVSDYVSMSEQVYVLNLKPVFERIERATGDHWRTWAELSGKP